MSEEGPQDASGLGPLYRAYKHQKCFVGHSHEASWCADIVGACQEVLPEFGLEPWYAAHNFDPTRSLRDKVVEMIANTRYGIYDLSYWRKDNKSSWVMPCNVLIELGMAIVLNRPILLLQHAENRKLGPKLPKCLESVSEYILEFSGEGSLKRILRERLPHWVNALPERDWWNRYCLFGGIECKYREVHPRGVQLGKEKLYCHISDGLDADRPDFREVIGKVLKRFTDVEFDYLDNLPMSSGYNFLLCTHCQTVRSTPFAIYRLSTETSGETFIAIGMSIALEKQFEYKIPKIILTANMQDIPSLLTGYDVVVARNDQDRKKRLREFVPEVIQRVRETTWRPRPLPFEMSMLKQDEILISKGRGAPVEEEKVRTDTISPPFDIALFATPERFIERTEDLQKLLERLRAVSSITTLYGMAGTGKSALAAVAIRQLHNEGRFPDGIVVVPCQGLNDAVEALRHVVVRFTPKDQLYEVNSPPGLAEVTRQVLGGKNALIVLEDVQPELALEDVIKPLREVGVTLLLTSRSKLSYIGISNEATHELKRAMTGAMLTLDDTKETTTDLDKQYEDIIQRLLTEDREYSADDVEGPGKDEQELEEDLTGLEPAPLELEEMSDMYEDLTQLPSSPEKEVQDVFLTEDGRQRALSQLEFLRTVRRAEVAQYLHDAKEAGDVVDNAAYEDAKNEQARLEGRIIELEQMLAKAKSINRMQTDLVSLGSVVQLRTSDDREYCYTLVGPFEANPSAGRISNESPVGKALLGHKVGDLVIVSTPGGVKEYTILSIE